MRLPETLAREIITSHHKRPRHLGSQPGEPHAALTNPGCGDQVTVWAAQTGGVLHLTFEGQGCAISQASASLMTGLLNGKTPQEAQKLAGQFRAMVCREPRPPTSWAIWRRSRVSANYTPGESAPCWPGTRLMRRWPDRNQPRKLSMVQMGV